MKILNFLDYISEKISVLNTDGPSVISSVNQINDLESHIKEFNSKKTELMNIYLTAKDEVSLIDNLKARGFINPSTNKSEIEFKNPLLGKFGNVCNLRKKIKDLESQEVEVNNSIKDKESQLTQNPSMKSSTTEDIKLKKTDIESIKRKIGEIKAESDRIERLTMKELQEMQDKLTSGTKDVRQSRSEIGKK